MGQKVNPTGIRLKIVKDWKSRWYANRRDFSKALLSDIRAREFLMKKLAGNAVSDIQIERSTRNTSRVIIYSGRPGTIIGKKGDEIENLRKKVGEILGGAVTINVFEIKKPELDAALVAESIAQQLERRVMFRRAMKKAVSSALRLGAKGIKIKVSGRLGGAEIARTEWYKEGSVPLQTFRADIDYATAEAKTTYGIIGVKIWIYKGEVIGKQKKDAEVQQVA